MFMILLKFSCGFVSLNYPNTEQFSCAAGWKQRAEGRLGASSGSHVPQNSRPPSPAAKSRC
jgi:hypothetical protein